MQINICCWLNHATTKNLTQLFVLWVLIPTLYPTSCFVIFHSSSTPLSATLSFSLSLSFPSHSFQRLRHLYNYNYSRKKEYVYCTLISKYKNFKASLYLTITKERYYLSRINNRKIEMYYFSHIWMNRFTYISLLWRHKNRFWHGLTLLIAEHPTTIIWSLTQGWLTFGATFTIGLSCGNCGGSVLKMTNEIYSLVMLKQWLCSKEIKSIIAKL